MISRNPISLHNLSSSSLIIISLLCFKQTHKRMFAKARMEWEEEICPQFGSIHRYSWILNWNIFWMSIKLFFCLPTKSSDDSFFLRTVPRVYRSQGALLLVYLWTGAEFDEDYRWWQDYRKLKSNVSWPLTSIVKSWSINIHPSPCQHKTFFCINKD